MSNGGANPGTQLKITNYISCMCILPIAFWYIENPEINPKQGVLSKIGDYSFGIFLIHILVLNLLKKFNFYDSIPFPVSSLSVLILSYISIYICNKFLGEKYGKWLGFV